MQQEDSNQDQSQTRTTTQVKQEALQQQQQQQLQPLTQTQQDDGNLSQHIQLQQLQLLCFLLQQQTSQQLQQSNNHEQIRDAEDEQLSAKSPTLSTTDVEDDNEDDDEFNDDFNFSIEPAATSIQANGQTGNSEVATSVTNSAIESALAQPILVAAAAAAAARGPVTSLGPILGAPQAGNIGPIRPVDLSLRQRHRLNTLNQRYQNHHNHHHNHHQQLQHHQFQQQHHHHHHHQLQLPTTRSSRHHHNSTTASAHLHHNHHRFNLLGVHHHHSSIQTQQQLLATQGFNPLAALVGQQTEILTPTHLRKAKLMFFYVRYPNSSTLKECFRDVRFNKNNTAQLVKWFSNFREFYYIQMEKFARDAVTDDKIQCKDDIVVTFEHEIINQLNNHYNKNRHIELPEVFRQVVEETLKHFFDAIQNKRDQEQSWKKVIYKQIARLDQEVPDVFKTDAFNEHLE